MKTFEYHREVTGNPEAGEAGVRLHAHPPRRLRQKDGLEFKSILGYTVQEQLETQRPFVYKTFSKNNNYICQKGGTGKQWFLLSKRVFNLCRLEAQRTFSVYLPWNSTWKQEHSLLGLSKPLWHCLEASAEAQTLTQKSKIFTLLPY